VPAHLLSDKTRPCVCPRPRTQIHYIVFDFVHSSLQIRFFRSYRLLELMYGIENVDMEWSAWPQEKRSAGCFRIGWAGPWTYHNCFGYFRIALLVLPLSVLTTSVMFSYSAPIYRESCRIEFGRPEVACFWASAYATHSRHGGAQDAGAGLPSEPLTAAFTSWWGLSTRAYPLHPQYVSDRVARDGRISARHAVGPEVEAHYTAKPMDGDSYAVSGVSGGCASTLRVLCPLSVTGFQERYDVIEAGLKLDCEGLGAEAKNAEACFMFTLVVPSPPDVPAENRTRVHMFSLLVVPQYLPRVDHHVVCYRVAPDGSDITADEFVGELALEGETLRIHIVPSTIAPRLRMFHVETSCELAYRLACDARVAGGTLTRRLLTYTVPQDIRLMVLGANTDSDPIVLWRPGMTVKDARSLREPRQAEDGNELRGMSNDDPLNTTAQRRGRGRGRGEGGARGRRGAPARGRAAGRGRGRGGPAADPPPAP